MTRALLITGSRALDDSRHEAAARAEIARAVEGASEIWHGGAVGPDTWADEAAGETPRHIYLPDGRIHRWQTDLLLRTRRPGGLYPFDPLLRNREMVAEFARQHPDGIVLGLVAEWSVSHGTEYTLGLARRAGLNVVEVRYER